ncbi:FtsX-like permease family protein [Actinoplanes sichuanensis]|uniref:FtsX-like permease family protein n=1 Tax=Actinoplanes sichuanensis TaxID=512349 RepID=A0ABW4A5Q8_9ACTN|nr:FtsX-like permease family protein [Actinoplanes sichuanensis]
MTLSSLRARWATLIGTFVALALGVALLTTMGLALASTLDAPPQHPSRLAGAPVVVRGVDELRVATPIGDRTQPLAQPHAVPPAVVTALARAAPTVPDRSFPVSVSLSPPAAIELVPSGATGASPPTRASPPPRTSPPPASLPGTSQPPASPPQPPTSPPPTSPPARTSPPPASPVPGTRSVPEVARAVDLFAEAGSLVGHPWAIAEFGGHRLVAGHEPRESAEIALVADPALVGRTVRVRTPAGSGDYTVAGVLAPVSFERAVFFADGVAASIAPHIDNLVVAADPESVRAIVSAFPGVQVLTGDERRRADPDPNRDSDALVAMNALLGTAGGVTTFVSVFVVASTFAFAVAQRRREIGLLRMAGATPGQIRRTVFAEAAVVGAVSAAAGCVLGSYGAPWLARLLVDERLAPAWFTIGDHLWPYHVAFWTGLLVALAGVVVATVRAGRVRPTEALREASVDSRAMTAGRWIFGFGILAAGVGLLCWRLLSDPGETLHRKTYTTQPMLLITAVALLAPVLAGPLARLVAWLPARLPGATGLLMRENASAAVRRTAAVAAPVLITVALAGSLLGTTATIAEAKATEQRTQTAADLIVTGSPGQGGPIGAETGESAGADLGGPIGAETGESAGADLGGPIGAKPGKSADAEHGGPAGAEHGRPAGAEQGGSAGAEQGGSAGAETLDARTVGAIRAVPGARVMTSASTAVYTLEDGVALVRSQARVVDASTLSVVRNLPVKAGRVDDLDEDAIIVNEEWAEHTVGTRVDLWLGDGTPRNLRVVAVLATGTGSNGVYVTAANAGGAQPDQLELSWAPGADARSGEAAVRRIVDPSVRPGADGDGGMRVWTREQWLADQIPASSRQTRVGFMVVLGIALLYTGIAIANTMVMATSDRARELAILRLTGATRRQVLRLVAAEALTVVVVGAVLGLLVTALNLAGIWAALAVLSVWVPIVVPTSALAVTLAACAVVAVSAAVVPTVAALRTRPVDLAGTRE